MIQKLPNEILVKILEKTNRKTNQNCRLLNSRFDNIIKKFDLLKKDDEISLSQSGWNRMYGINIPMRKKNKEMTTKYYSQSEMITAAIQLLRYKVKTNTQLRKPVHTSALRSLSSLGIYRCFFKCNSTDKWFSYLSQLRLNDFTVLTSTEDTFIPIPETILNNVANRFDYQNGTLNIMKNEFDLPWMNNLVLEKWFSPEKTFNISQVKTAFTLEAVVRCIKMLPLNIAYGKKIIFDFGILANVTSEKCERLLTDACGSEWSSQDYASNVKYFSYDAIKTRRSRSSRIAFGIPL